MPRPQGGVGPGEGIRVHQLYDLGYLWGTYGVPMGYLWGTYGVPSVVSHTVAVIAISHISPPCRIQHVSHGKTHGKKHQRVR